MDELLSGLAAFLDEPESYCKDRKALQRYGFGDHRVFHSLIARDADMPVGLTVFFPEFSTWRGQPGVYIQDLYVTPSHRGSGLGRDLVLATLEYARSEWESGYVRLSADHRNVKAIRFYERLGFRVDRENIILKLGGDVVAGSGPGDG